jgi:sialic acid synthase SpsE
MYKIASPEITDHGLIEVCAKTKKPVILSTGLASRCDLDSAMSVLAKYSSPKMILKCVSAYPTVLEDMNVSSIPWLANLYNIVVGLSDHSVGSEAAVAATALGARLIEKHFRLDDDDRSVDSHFSMSLNQLPRFKKTVNEVYSAIGEPTLELPDSAKRLLSGRRSLYVVQDIKQGEKFTHENIRSIRPSYGMPPKFLPHVIGLTASRELETGERLTAEKITNWSISDD